MLLDEKIKELSEADAKKILRRAVEVVAEKMVCESCAVRIVCGKEPTTDVCMCRVMTLLAVPKAEEVANEEEPTEAAEGEDEGGVVYYDPETMKIVD